ncbi:MAG: hypothetical protein WC710_15185 [Gallionella sp.]|jgi:hypothetical protein
MSKDQWHADAQNEDSGLKIRQQLEQVELQRSLVISVEKLTDVSAQTQVALLELVRALHMQCQRIELLIEAMGNEPGRDEDAPVTHYLNGKPIRG